MTTGDYLKLNREELRAIIGSYLTTNLGSQFRIPSTLIKIRTHSDATWTAELDDWQDSERLPALYGKLGLAPDQQKKSCLTQALCLHIVSQASGRIGQRYKESPRKFAKSYCIEATNEFLFLT